MKRDKFVEVVHQRLAGVMEAANLQSPRDLEAWIELLNDCIREEPVPRPCEDVLLGAGLGIKRHAETKKILAFMFHDEDERYFEIDVEDLDEDWKDYLWSALKLDQENS